MAHWNLTTVAMGAYGIMKLNDNCSYWFYAEPGTSATYYPKKYNHSKMKYEGYIDTWSRTYAVYSYDMDLDEVCYIAYFTGSRTS